jgi:FG-GAP-like repeat/IPT/TIG domain/Secretion system C-terminal sorting domain
MKSCLYVLRRSKLFIGSCLFMSIGAQCFAQVPVITSISPATGPAGGTVVISGTNFGTSISGNTVLFGAVKASIISASAGTLTVIVPTGATCMPVTVTTNGLTAYSPKPFILTFSGAGSLSSSSFDQRLDFGTDLHPNGVVMTDFDGDGKTDIATPNNYSITGNSSSSISILRNTGSPGAPAFAQAINLPTGVLTYALAAGDINGDGKPDLVSVSVQANTVFIWLNTSSSSSISFSAGPGYATGTTPSAVAVYDLDGDGKPDIVVLNEMSNSLSVFRNISTAGTVAFATRVDVATGNLPSGMAVGDLDGDGKADVAVVNNLSNTISLFRNTCSPGTIAFAARGDIATTAGTDNPYAVAIADADGDGKSDLIVSNNNVTTVNAALVSFTIFQNTSTMSNLSFANAGNFGSGNSYEIGVGDLNGDGKPDLVIPTQVAGNINVYTNSSVPGTISMTASAVLTSISPFAPGIGDIDGDGIPDLVVSNFTSSLLSVFRNRILVPTITNVAPLTAAAGATLTITGVNFTGCTGVSIGSIAAASFTVVSDNKITAVVGSGASGAVVVTGPRGSGSYAGFVFAGAPIIQSFSPLNAGQGQVVTIVGLNLSNVNVVNFGGVSASSYTVVSADTVTAIVNAGATGAVSVTGAYGTDSLAGFTYTPLPAITSLVPVYAGNGVPITINGQNFTGVTGVSFGGVPASSFTVVNSSTITAAPGAGASGQVVVTTANGSVSYDHFLWLPAPTLNSFSPAFGIYGTVLTLTGAHFTDTQYGSGIFKSVTIGGVDYTNYITYGNITADTITITLNGPTPASGDIVVSTWGGTATLHGFSYYSRPVFKAIQPVIAGTGMPVTILGSNFTGTSSVSLGGVPVSSYTVVSPDTITAIVGAGASGNVIITNPAGSDITNPAFIYTEAPLIFSYSPNTGPVGTVVTINGGNFSSDDIVYFGGVKAKPISVNFTQITVAVPPSAGYRPVSVTSSSLLQSAITDVPFDVTFPSDVNAFNASSFAGHMEFGTGVQPTDLAIGDLDGDGKQDIATVNFQDGTVSIFRNTSSGANISFEPRMDILVGSYTKNIGVADIDGDGLLDIIISEGNSDNCGGCGPTGIIILRNISTPGKLAFSKPVNITTDYKMDYMAIGDLNRDGKPDIVGGTYDLTGEFIPEYTFQNNSSNGNISFITLAFGVTIPLFGQEAFFEGVSIRDMDGDGFPDVTLGTRGAGFESVSTNINGYAGIFLQNHMVANQYLDLGASYPVVANFLQGPYPDIVTSGPMFGNQGNFNFTQLGYLNIGGPGVACDLNGDGKPDMVRTGLTGDSVIYVFKDSTVSPIPFAANVNYPALNTFKHVIAGDLDGDGKPEIIVSNKNYNSISIFRNRIGEPALSAPVINTFTPDSGGYATAIAISGSHFNQATNISVGGLPVSSFTVVSDNTITAIVDTGTSGDVSVTTPGGTATAGTFTYQSTALPIITSIIPATAISGTEVVITGINFQGLTGASFGNSPAGQYTVISPTRILAVVDTSTSDTITLTNAAGAGTIGGFVFVGTPGIQIDGSNPFCQGQQLRLIASTSNVNATYQWYNGTTAIGGATRDTLAVDSAGTYSVNTVVNDVSSPVSEGSTIGVHPLPVTPVISQLGDTLLSSAASGNGWYNDTSAAALDTGQILLPGAPGRYWLRAAQNGCVSAFSPAFTYKPPSIDTTNRGEHLIFAPNPATSFVVANFTLTGTILINVEIYDINGRLEVTYPQVSNGARLNVAGLSAGLYFIKAYDFSGKALGVQKLFKL